MNQEHHAMLDCKCSDADRMSFVCLKCGAVHLWDPSLLVIAVFVVLFAWNLHAWMTM